jgi:hypothetical protein
MPSTSDWLGIGSLATNALGGLAAGADGSDEQRDMQLRDDQLFALLLQAMQEQGNIEQSISSENFNRASGFANANPLGAEQRLRQDTVLGRAGLEALGGRQLARGTPNIAAGFMDRPGVREALSDNAVNESIRQRRIATAGIDPRAAAEIGSPNGYADRLFGELQGNQDQRRQIGSNVLDQVNQRRAQLAQQMQEAEDDGGGFWKKLGGTLLGIGGVAANFIPGVGPVAGALISSAAGAAGGGLAGGRRGAAIGAGLGLGGSLGANALENRLAPQARQFNNSMTQASLPYPMQGAAVQAPGAGMLQIPSTPNVGMANFPGAVPNHRPPMIQQALAQGPPRAQQAPVPSGPGINLNSIPPGVLPQYMNRPGNPNLNTQAMRNDPNAMPLVQAGLGYQPDVKRLFETVGDARPKGQRGRMDVAQVLAAILGMGASSGAPALKSMWGARNSVPIGAKPRLDNIEALRRAYANAGPRGIK